MEKESRIRATREQQIALYDSKKIKFLREAIIEGADKKLPRNVEPEEWQRIKDIGKAYSYMPLTFQDLGILYGEPEKPLSRARIEQIHAKFIERLWGNCSPDLQKGFPLQDIFVRKPLSTEFNRRSSAAGGGIALKVEQLTVDKGVMRPSQIAQELDISRNSAVHAKKVLRGWGVDIPKDNITLSERLHDIQWDDDKRNQEILDSISDNSIRSGLRAKKADIVVLGNVVRDMGMNCNSWRTRELYEAIKESGIPIRMVKAHKQNKYYVVLWKDVYRAQDVLKKHLENVGDGPQEYGMFP